MSLSSEASDADRYNMRSVEQNGSLWRCRANGFALQMINTTVIVAA
ncbi:MAG: hypothetical protein MK103_10685 [Planctomycetes bacterium]|nr:hypothetical protein [Planctomycetota bacterium]